MKRRILGLLLALCMVLSLLPATALADGGNEAITVKSGSNVIFDGVTTGVHYAKLGAKGAVESTAEETYNVKLDYSGSTPKLYLKGLAIALGTTKTAGALSASGSGALEIVVETNSSLSGAGQPLVQLDMGGMTTITGPGKLTLTSNNGNYRCLIANGNLTLKNADLSISGSSTNAAAWELVQVNGDLAIEGGTFAATISRTTARGINVANKLTISAGADVTVTKSSTGTSTLAVDMYGINAKSLELKGGKLTVTDAAAYNYNATKVSRPINVTEGINATPAAGDSVKITTDVGVYDDISKVENIGVCRSVSIEYICGQHKFDNDISTADACQKCGATNAAAEPITMTVIEAVEEKEDETKEVTKTTWNVALNEIYYAQTDADGNITYLGKQTEEPEDWQIKLDNTKEVAELTLNGANIAKQVKISGDGNLKIIVAGEVTITAEEFEDTNQGALDLTMAGGTTITGTGNLEVKSGHSSSYHPLRASTSKNGLILDHVNMSVRHIYSGNYAYAAVQVSGYMHIKGGSLNILRTGTAGTGISVGTLEISEGAQVTVTKTSTPTSKASRHVYGINTDALIFNGGKLTISDSHTYYGVNNNDRDWYNLTLGNSTGNTTYAATPITLSAADGDTVKVVLEGRLVDGEAVNNTYEGTAAEVMADINNETNLYEYRNVTIEYICGEHTYTNNVCTKCGAVDEPEVCTHPNAPTEQENCEVEVTCPDCSAVVFEKKEHNWEQTGTTAGNCQTNSTTSYECEDCGATKTDEGAKGAHAWSETLTAGETTHYYECTIEGCEETTGVADHTYEYANTGVGTCTCGATKDCAHNWEQTDATAGNCQTASTTSFECSICKATKTEQGAIGDHAWSETLTAGETTHYYECTIEGCEEKSGVANHTYEYANTGEGICTCGATTNCDHDWEVTGTTPGDCQTNSTTSFECSVCKKTKTEQGAIGDHAWSENWSYDEEGHYHVCTIDGCNATDEKIPHVYENYVANTPADFGKDATEIGTCVCGDTDIRVVADSALKAVAQIGDKQYTSLQAAIDEANADETVELIANVEVTGAVKIEKSITLDLGKYNITRNGTGDKDAAVFVSGGDVVITGTTGGVTAAPYAPAIWIKAGVLTIKGGNFVGGNHAVYALGTGSVIVEGGKFEYTDKECKGLVLNIIDECSETASIVVKGGTYVGFNPENNISEGAGTDYTADGYIAIDNGDGTYTVREGKWVAQIGEQKFETLADAIAAATEGQTVKLIANVEVTGAVKIEKSITLDLGKYNITRNGTGDKDAAVFVSGGDVVITGTTGGVTAAPYAPAIWIKAGVLTIKGGNFVGGNHAVYALGTGSVIVEGGKFEYTDKECKGLVLNIIDECSETASIVVKGGTYVGFNPENNISEGAGTDYTADGYIAIDNGDGTYTVREGKWVAQVGDEKFETLQEAINKANAGDTVTLLESVEVTAFVRIDKAITLDLGTKSVTRVNGTGIYVTNVEGTVTIMNGSVTASDTAIYVSEANVDIYDCTVINTADAEAVYLDDSGIINIYSGTYKAEQFVQFTLNIDDDDKDNCTINVYGGKFYNFDPANSASETPAVNFLADKTQHTAQDDEGYFAICKGTYTSAVTNPTCTEQGYTTHTCSACPSEYVDTYVDAINHANAYAGEAKDATCTEDGHTAGIFCPDCNEWIDPQTPIKGGHDFSVFVRKVEPTNTITGYTLYKCANCDETEVRDKVAAFVNAVAEFDGKYYETFEDALTAAKASESNEKVITMLKYTSDALFIDADVIVDFNHRAYTFNTANADGAAITIAEGATVTLRNGTIQTRFTARTLFNYLIVNNGTLTTQNITLRGDNLYADGTTATIVNNNTLSLEAGTVVVVRVSGLIADSAIATTKDASVALEAPENCDWENDTTLVEHTHKYVDEVVEPNFERSGYTKHTCKCGYSYIDNIVYAPVAYAVNTDTGVQYTTLAQAVAEAGKDETVKLLKKQTGAALVFNADNITVNFNGNVYTVNDDEGKAAVVIANGLTVNFTNGDAEQNGMIQIRFTYRKDFDCLVNNQGTLNVESAVTLNAANAQAEGATAIKGNDPVAI